MQVELSAAASQPILSGDARSYWSPLGNFRPAVGGRASIGYDWSSYGAAVSLEAATASVGPRFGATYGVAALGYWMPSVQIGAWRPRATLGYVREGILMNDVMPSETNSSATRIQTVALGARNVGMTGNGARIGLAIERPLSRVTLTTGVEFDIVGFDTVTDDTGTGDSEDISLKRTSWSTVPRLTVGIRFHP
jgi:hypothetical protein